MAISHHSAFEFVKEAKIDSLNIHYQEFRHKETGAQHIHLAADSEENVFTVALRTVPTDSKGVAHILEHTALCGSEKYPTNAPFMSMMSRSLNTFMNAFTSSDWTAYPFASQNTKDFSNLMSVYLDAVFFPKLDPLAFAQEGHRVEFAEPNNPESDLIYKGVVFNEMKGAMSPESSQLMYATLEHLYRNSTYHYNSGGTPADITDLTYEEFKAFYDVHYHPSNAIFLTYGNLNAQSHQQQFEDNALNRFKKLDVKIEVESEERFTEPKRCDADYSIAAQDSTEDKTYITVSWLLGNSTDLQELLTTKLLGSLLIGNSASPLRQALEKSTLGKTVAPTTGLNPNAKEMSFTAGLAGSNPEHAEAIEQLILDVLTDVAENGLPKDMIDGFLHQFELSQREVTGGQFPYGLQLILSSLNMATHYGDAVQALNTDEALNELRTKVSDPEFIKSAVKRLLLNNPHRLLMVLKPSTTKAAEMIKKETQKLAELKSTLSDADKQKIIDNTALLEARQSEVENKDILPKVTVADVEKTVKHQAPKLVDKGNIDITAYEAGTNGLVYQKVVISMPALSDNELQLLPIYSSLVSSLGVGEMDYAQTQVFKNGILGHMSVGASLQADKSDANKIHGYLYFSTNGLNGNQKQMTEFLAASLQDVRFDETQRIADIVSMIRSNMESSVLQNGQSYAMNAAASEMSQSAKINQIISGLSLVKFVKELEKNIKQPDALTALAQQLESFHNKVLKETRQALLVCESAQLNAFTQVMQANLNNVDNASNVKADFNLALNPQDCAWVTNTQVNFCGRAYPTVSMTHPDAAKLAVLGAFLRQNFLHQALREQGGAYGGGAKQDSESATFKMFSYRDPRLQETLDDFDEAVDWIQTADISDEKIDEAILSIISSMDKPFSPSQFASISFDRDLTGETLEARETYRKQLLSVKATDLKQVAKTYLDPTKAQTAVITNAQGAEELGFSVIEL